MPGQTPRPNQEDLALRAAETAATHTAGRGRRDDPVAERRVAYALLVKMHEHDLLRTARRLCAGREDWAQDLVQDALVRGYEAYAQGRFQTGTNARAWLTRILTNGFINEYNRRRKWEAETDLDTLTAPGAIQPPGLTAPETERPESALLTQTLDEPLERALATLSAELRACVILVDVHGAEYAEAARALDIPIGTVRSRLARARMQLHALLYGYAQAHGRV